MANHVQTRLAVHREEPRPWVMDDYLALGLAGRDGLALLDRLRAEVPSPYLLAFSRWMCVIRMCAFSGNVKPGDVSATQFSSVLADGSRRNV